MVIDDNKDYVTKSKLKTTVNTLSKYNDRSKVASKQTNKQTNKQTQRQRNWQTLRQKTKRHTNRRTNKLTVDTRTEGVK